MKFCKRPFELFNLFNEDGDVSVCSWLLPEFKIGNILEQDVDEIWHSEAAKQCRESVLDGSFRYCRREICTYLFRDELPEIKNESDTVTADMPVDIRVAFDRTCNLTCPACRDRVYVPTERQKANMDIIYEKIFPYLQHASRFNFGGRGEPFVSPFYMRVLENFKPENPKTLIRFETNGVLFNEENWNKIAHLAKCNLHVYVSVDSLYAPTYNYLRRGGNLEKVKNNLKFISKLRKKEDIKMLTIVMVVQESNFREMPDFVRYGLDVLGVDQVSFMPIYNKGNMSEAEMLVKDVLNPAHPYHQEFMKIMEHPLVKQPRVRIWTGDVLHERKEIISRKAETS
jgi:radical SAM protein with 4Fe4S-binding SPASM domain